MTQPNPFDQDAEERRLRERTGLLLKLWTGTLPETGSVAESYDPDHPPIRSNLRALPRTVKTILARFLIFVGLCAYILIFLAVLAAVAVLLFGGAFLILQEIGLQFSWKLRE